MFVCIQSCFSVAETCLFWSAAGKVTVGLAESSGNLETGGLIYNNNIIQIPNFSLISS